MINRLMMLCSAFGVLTVGASAQTCDITGPTEIYAPLPSGQDQFGFACAIRGDLLAISDNDPEFFETETVYVYRRVGGQWSFEESIAREPVNHATGFGLDLAISGEQIIVGYHREDDDVLGEEAGSVYVYEYLGGQWTETQRLTASDAAPEDRFGNFVDVFGDILIIAATGGTTNGQNTGALYQFEHDGSQWVEVDKIEPTVPAPYTFAIGPMDRIGNSLFIGNPMGRNAQGVQTGVVHEIRLVGGSWEYHTTHEPTNTASNSFFGTSVAAAGSTLLIGDPGDNLNGFYAGAVYVLEPAAGEWEVAAKLRPQDGAFGGAFGETVVAQGDHFFASGNTLLTSQRGAIYHYSLDNGAWIQQTKIQSPSTDRTSFASFSLEFDGGTLVAPDDYGPTQPDPVGVVYVYDLECSQPCPGDTNADGVLSPADFSAWIAAFNAMLPACDQNADGSCTPADFSAWIANYNAGC